MRGRKRRDLRCSPQSEHGEDDGGQQRDSELSVDGDGRGVGERDDEDDEEDDRVIVAEEELRVGDAEREDCAGQVGQAHGPGVSIVELELPAEINPIEKARGEEEEEDRRGGAGKGDVRAMSVPADGFLGIERVGRD